MGVTRILISGPRVLTNFLIAVALLAAATAQNPQIDDFRTLDQAASRTGVDYAPAYEGQSIAVRGQIASLPVWALGSYYLPLRDESEHGLLLDGEARQFIGLAPGDWVEVHGVIRNRGGLPLLAPVSIQKLSHELPPTAKDLTLPEISGLRYLGLVVRTEATVISASQNLGGDVLSVRDDGVSVSVFFPHAADSGGRSSTRLLKDIQVGDRVRLTGLATQYNLMPPYDRDFQIMLASAAGVQVLETGSVLPTDLLVTALGAIAFLLGLWWLRERRIRRQRHSLHAFHALSEEIIGAASPAEIAEKLAGVLPTIMRATEVRLYLFNRRTKCLELVPTRADSDPMALPVDTPAAGLANGVVSCFNNRALISIPDVRRSPLIKAGPHARLPRSAMFVPLLAQNEETGVLEVGDARHVGYFSMEEQAAAQHLSNQVAASLKLQAQQNMREQLFRSEKLAATGQLISGVAGELRAPLESILQLATSLASYDGRSVPERELRLLAGESHRASEIVARLVSFARPEDAAVRQVDVLALVGGLIKFREPEWKTLGLRVQNRLSPESAPVLGVAGQIEQVFLNLLVHAEQCTADAPGKALTVSSSVIAHRLLIEISYSTPAHSRTVGAEADPFADASPSDHGALGLAVCQGIIRNHGGELRFRTRSGIADFEVELPMIADSIVGATAAVAAARAFTMMIVDLNGGQRQLMAMLGARHHRVVPVAPEEAVELAQRLRFDAVLWTSRQGGPPWAELQQRIRSHIPAFVLVTEVYDPELARNLEAVGAFLLVRPFQEKDLDRILKAIEAQSFPIARPNR